MERHELALELSKRAIRNLIAMNERLAACSASFRDGNRDLEAALRLIESMERHAGVLEGPEQQDPWEAA